MSVSSSALQRLAAPLGWIYDWCTHADSIRDADMIFVLAGRQGRKSCGLELFYKGRAPGILLSTGRFEIRKLEELSLPAQINLLELARKVPPSLRHFFVFFEGETASAEWIEPRPFGTLNEIESLARWLHSRENIRSLCIVSSAPHLRRVRICCRALVPEWMRVGLVAVPGERPGYDRSRWWRDRETFTEMLLELLKIPCYKLLLTFRRLTKITPQKKSP